MRPKLMNWFPNCSRKAVASWRRTSLHLLFSPHKICSGYFCKLNTNFTFHSLCKECMPNVWIINMWKKMELTLCHSKLKLFEVFPYSEHSKFSFSWNVNRAINHRCIFYIIRKIKNVAIAACKALTLKLRKCVI